MFSNFAELVLMTRCLSNRRNELGILVVLRGSMTFVSHGHVCCRGFESLHTA